MTRKWVYQVIWSNDIGNNSSLNEKDGEGWELVAVEGKYFYFRRPHISNQEDELPTRKREIEVLFVRGLQLDYMRFTDWYDFADWMKSYGRVTIIYWQYVDKRM